MASTTVGCSKGSIGIDRRYDLGGSADTGFNGNTQPIVRLIVGRLLLTGLVLPKAVDKFNGQAVEFVSPDDHIQIDPVVISRGWDYLTQGYNIQKRLFRNGTTAITFIAI